GDVQPIFTARCAVLGCHVGPFPAQGLELAEGSSWAAIVGQPSTEKPGVKLVDAGSATTSYLLWKISEAPAGEFIGGTMILLPGGLRGPFRSHAAARPPRSAPPARRLGRGPARRHRRLRERHQGDLSRRRPGQSAARPHLVPPRAGPRGGGYGDRGGPVGTAGAGRRPRGGVALAPVRGAWAAALPRT